MTYFPLKLFLNISLFFLSGLFFASSTIAACNLTPQQILRDDVLIVVNDNSITSPQVGDYYCEQRGIDPANVAHVSVPVTNDIQLDQFVSLRDQLIKHMQENTLLAGVNPVTCDTSQGYTRYYCPESMDQLSQKSKIRYIVMTKGLPIRFRFTGSKLDGNLEASVDNYLRFWLSDYFSEDVAFKVGFNDRAVDFGDGRGMRTVNTVIDRELIVGRIDGVDIESAKRLVDRAINAEKSGIFGKLYGNKYGGTAIRKSLDEGAFWKIWLPDRATAQIYPKLGSGEAGWHYLHGLFGELQGVDEPAVRHTTNPVCTSLDVNGKIPKQCVVAVNRGAINDNPNFGLDLPPGSPEGRIPSPDNALFHQGYFDTFSSLLEFDHLLNWHDTNDINGNVCNTLCNQVDPVEAASCRLASTDAYKEIDTRCVRVAEGYMGYTFNSYPVGMMASWPTGWFQSANYHPEKFDQTGSHHYYFWQPEVRTDDGYDDDFSLWYRNTDNNPSAACYSGTEDYKAAPGNNCNIEKRISINQTINITERAVDPNNPQEITIRFKYRAIGLANNVNLSARLLIRESSNGTSLSPTNQLDYGNLNVKTLIAPNDPLDGNSWGDAVVTFTLDPTKHLHPTRLYDAIRLSINVPLAFDGELAFDDFSVDEDGTNIPLTNPSFDDGHRQLSGGDSAATFLSRLNGLAFWGNITHHEFNGHSFERNPYEILIYFLRGLPLGDAVWFAEFHNSGIFYGDPIYTPIAIHLDYLSATDNRAPDDHFNIVADSPLALTGDTLNGSGVDVTSTYSVDYCSGNDFFPCDESGSWQPITNMQNRSGGQRSLPGSPGIPLGDWDISNLAEGDYVLRLAVTTTNSTKGLTQTFYDYYDVTMYSPTTGEDFDSDGLSYQEEIAAGTNPWNDDTDADGLPDQWEVSNGLDALTVNTDEDSDNDGSTDLVEFLRGTNPTDDQSKPAVSILEVDLVNGIDDGLSPFKTVGAATGSAQAGDTILLLPGKHIGGISVSFTVPVHLQGSANQSSTLETASFASGGAGSTVNSVIISDLIITSFTTDISIASSNNSNNWRFERNRFNRNVTIESGSSVEFVNNVFINASADAIKLLEGSSAVLRNNTLAGNNVGVRTDIGSSVQIINSIISGNTSADLIGVPPGAVSFSLISDASYSGANGNISSDPLFVDPLNGDYHLKPESPAIDAGDPQSDFSQEPPSDIGRINLGLYGNTSEATIAAAKTSGGGSNQGSSSGQINGLLLFWFSIYGLWRIHNKHKIIY